MSTVQTAMKLAVDLRECPRVLHYAPIQLLEIEENDKAVGQAFATVVSYDVSRSGMRVFSAIEIDVPMFAVRFWTPTGMEVTQPARIVRTVHRNEWIWEYGLQFESLLPESAL